MECANSFLFRPLAFGERHSVATVVLDVGEHLTDPVMFLWVLAPVFELVAVFGVGVELCDRVSERGRCGERFFEAAGAYVNLF